MRVDYEARAHAYVEEFVARALPDARDVGGSRVHVVVGEGGCAVDVDIPTSADNCWLEFTLDAQGGSPAIVAALRSGRAEDQGSVYAWDERKGSWQLVGHQPSGS